MPTTPRRPTRAARAATPDLVASNDAPPSALPAFPALPASQWTYLAGLFDTGGTLLVKRTASGLYLGLNIRHRAPALLAALAAQWPTSVLTARGLRMSRHAADAFLRGIAPYTLTYGRAIALYLQLREHQGLPGAFSGAARESLEAQLRAALRARHGATTPLDALAGD